MLLLIIKISLILLNFELNLIYNYNLICFIAQISA
jgi:hypothetical protein